jgi:voltage-gated potassium channel
LASTLDRARFAYVVALSAIVVLVGAAGMLLFEGTGSATGGSGLATYGESLWWTGMIMTTIGTDYFPVTAEGRVLAWGLSVYAIGVFSYVTATMASHFLGLGSARSGEGSSEALAGEVAALRAEIGLLTQRLGETTP